MNPKPIVSRGDLLRCLTNVPEHAVGFVAEMCGFIGEETSKEPVAVAAKEPLPVAAPEPVPPRDAVPDPRTEPVRFLLPLKAGTHKPASPGRRGVLTWLERSEPSTEADLSPKDVSLPPTPPLQPWPRLWPYLRRVLGRSRQSARIDLPRLVRDVAELRPVLRLPRVCFVTWAERAWILMDRHHDVMPFWDDMEDLVGRVAKLRGKEGLHCRVLEEGLPSGVGRSLWKTGHRSADPGCSEPVLVLGDMGCLGQSSERTQAWAQYGRALQSQRGRCSALMPCPRERWDVEVARTWQSACWDRHENLPPGWRGLTPRRADPDSGDREMGVRSLLPLLSPALRVEPGLLRSLRLLLEPKVADVGTEYDVWNHGDASRTALAMALKPDEAMRLRKVFETTGDEKKLAAGDLLRRFHAACGDALRARETWNLHECGVPLEPGVLEKARQILRRLGALMFRIVTTRDTGQARRLLPFEWFEREMRRLSTNTRRGQEEIPVLWALARFYRGETAEQAPEGIDPKRVEWVWNLVMEDPGVDTTWEARLVGPDLVLARWTPPTPGVPPTTVETGSPVAWIRARRRWLTVEVEKERGDAERHSLITEQAPEIRVQVGRPKGLHLASDCAELEMGTVPRPEWARKMGRDRFGLFVELEVDGAVFLLRWIPPGDFLMGSPESEKGRFPDEVLHHVTLTQGFWLAATPCTQEQWKVVMGTEPSESQGPKRPVESVSWEECGEFCERLGERFRALDFRLPTEAEWEYACRARTTSAFNDGSECTEPTGKDPALEQLGWYDKNSGGETHPVGQKRANAWGLHDMHGNVWEWCADHCEFTEKVVTDTYVDDAVNPLCTKGARRVVRGGSFWIHAGHCRSACRFGFVPGLRDWSRGFRLAAGQPEARGAQGREVGGAERRAEGRGPVGIVVSGQA